MNSEETRSLLKKSGQIPEVAIEKASPGEAQILRMLLDQNTELTEIKGLARTTNGRVNRHEEAIRKLNDWKRLVEVREGTNIATRAAADTAVNEYRRKLWRIPKGIWAVVSIFGAGLGLEILRIFLKVFFHYQLP